MALAISLHIPSPTMGSIFLLLSFSSIISATTIQHNVTIHNTDSSIIYRPPSSWTSSANGNIQLLPIDCTLTTYRIAYLDPSDEGPSAEIPAIHPQIRQTDQQENDRRTQARSRRDCNNSGIIPTRDSSQLEPSINLQFKFTGTAVYLFGIASPPLPPAPSIIFTIDGEQLRTVPSDTGMSEDSRFCSMKEPIFSHTGLSGDLEHELSVSIYPNALFLLDHIIYTSPTQHHIKPRAEAPPSAESQKQHKIATFAATIVTVVGVLSIVSLIIIFSIIRRRRRARLRDLQESSDTNNTSNPPRIRAQRLSSSTTYSLSSSRFHTDASEDSPNPNLGSTMMMEGPVRFVPRFYPISVMPHQNATSHPTRVGGGGDEVEEQDPPPYDTSIGGDGLTSGQDTSYADVPPPSPPPLSPSHLTTPHSLNNPSPNNALLHPRTPSPPPPSPPTPPPLRSLSPPPTRRITPSPTSSMSSSEGFRNRGTGDDCVPPGLV